MLRLGVSDGPNEFFEFTFSCRSRPKRLERRGEVDGPPPGKGGWRSGESRGVLVSLVTSLSGKTVKVLEMVFRFGGFGDLGCALYRGLIVKRKRVRFSCRTIPRRKDSVV